jgi:mRNA interferase MazF
MQREILNKLDRVFRGDVHYVDLDPTKGSEIKKSRRCVVVSNDAINFNASVVIICPITDHYGKNSPIHIPIPENEGGLTKLSIAHCGQIRAVDKSRLEPKSGSLSLETMAEITKGIALAMNLPQYPQVIVRR